MQNRPTTMGDRWRQTSDPMHQNAQHDDIRLPASARPFLILGTLAVIAGGVVAAVTRPTDFEKGSWLAAYLVLVGGVALVGLGAGQALLVDEPVGPALIRGQIVGWVSSAAMVVVGTLTSTPVLTAVGGAVLLGVLATFFVSVRGSSRKGAVLWCYQAILLVVVVSIPIGLVLAWQRQS